MPKCTHLYIPVKLVCIFLLLLFLIELHHEYLLVVKEIKQHESFPGFILPVTYSNVSPDSHCQIRWASQFIVILCHLHLKYFLSNIFAIKNNMCNYKAVQDGLQLKVNNGSQL